MVYSYRLRLAAALALILPVLGHADSALRIPEEVVSGKPGKYEIAVTIPNRNYSEKNGLRGLLYLPATVDPAALSGAPMLVFFHGTSKDKGHYAKLLPLFAKYADSKKLIFLSVQNWHTLSGEWLLGAEESRTATNLIVNELTNRGVSNRNSVWLGGFSSGGITAITTFFHSLDHWSDPDFARNFSQMNNEAIVASGKSPEDFYSQFLTPREANFFPYAGVISVKGNFYREQFMGPEAGPSEMFSPFILDMKSHFRKLLAGKKIILTVGGKKDAARVRKQQPEARDFYRDTFDIEVEYAEFPNQGHAITAEDLAVLWRAMNL